MPKWFGVPALRGWLLALLPALVLAGCAAQQAFDDGKELAAQGKVEQALAKFQEAQTHDPHEVKYRQAYLQTRERALTSFVEQGDRMADAGAEDAARKFYERALAIEPSNDKARAGLERLDAGARNAALLKEADLALARKDIDGARQRTDSVLAADPANARALAMKRVIDETLAAQSGDAALAKAYRKTISIEFKDVALKQIFEVISRTSGLNFLFDKDVKTDQKASIFLKNSTIEAAVHYILLTNQLEQRVLDANTVLIYPGTPAKQKDYQEMAVRAFFLTNIEAKTMANTIKAIIKSRDIVVDEKLNMIMIRDTPEAIKVAERLVALQDVAEPEVMLEVEVLEVQKTLLQNLGIGWPASLSVTPLPLGTNLSDGGTGTTGATTTTGTTSTSSTLSLNDLLHQNRKSLGVTVGQASVNANLQDSDAKLLTNPRIRVRNHEKAKILIGERVPNITSTATSTGFVSQSISYIDVGLTLNVEPTIYLDDDVAIKVTLEVSSILNQFTTSSGTSAYEIGTRTASTVLQLKNGETDVLAGLIDNSESHSGNKIPGIGDFPILGRLFGNATDNDSKTEIVLSITPHLIRNIQRPDVNAANFLSGTESVMHSGPETDGVTMQTTSTSALPGISIGRDAVDTPVASAGTAQLQWQSPGRVAVGDTVQVSLVMQASQGIDSVPLTLGFDAGKLQVIGVSEGPFLRQGGSPTSFSSRIGSNNIAITDTSSSSTGATTQATVATVTFRALAPTSATEVRLLSAAPLSVSGTAVAAAVLAPLALQVVQP